MRARKLRSMLRSAYGQPPEAQDLAERMPEIRAYFAHRREAGLDPFTIDDATWGDLEMDQVFARLNAAQSTAGEQCLYARLRAPAVEEGEYRERARLLALAEREDGLRWSLLPILYRLGKRRGAGRSAVFAPEAHKGGKLALALGLSLGLIGCLIGMALLSSAFAPPLMALMLINPIYHFTTAGRLAHNLAAVNDALALITAYRRIRKLRDPALSALREALPGLFEAGERVRGISRLGGASFATGTDFATAFNALLLLDLITYERLRIRLGRAHADIFALHQALGELDAAIAIASYRHGEEKCCDPKIDFSESALPSFEVDGLRHPLVPNPTANSVRTERPLLITGSNASGKSTFLKASGIAALMAQAVCAAPCSAYRCTAFRLYSSMAISDAVTAGDSYFVAELRSLLRILHAASRGERVLCVIDEVLRGTNTVERIAASSEVLRALAGSGALCMAATHDGELCAMLAGAYRMHHFEERIVGREVLFDYRLREGPATTRNAIRLLDILGYDPAVVRRASEKAERYLRAGTWEA